MFLLLSVSLLWRLTSNLLLLTNFIIVRKTIIIIIGADFNSTDFCALSVWKSVSIKSKCYLPLSDICLRSQIDGIQVIVNKQIIFPSNDNKVGQTFVTCDVPKLLNSWRAVGRELLSGQGVWGQQTQRKVNRIAMFSTHSWNTIKAIAQTQENEIWLEVASIINSEIGALRLTIKTCLFLRFLFGRDKVDEWVEMCKLRSAFLGCEWDFRVITSVNDTLVALVPSQTDRLTRPEGSIFW